MLKINNRNSKEHPDFECRIEGQTVHISSHNATRIEVDLGEKGLRMKGIVKVFLNGKEMYSGEAGLFLLDDKNQY